MNSVQVFYRIKRKEIGFGTELSLFRVSTFVVLYGTVGGSLFLGRQKEADNIYLSTKKGEGFSSNSYHIRCCLLDSEIAKLARRAKHHAGDQIQIKNGQREKKKNLSVE